MRACHTEKKQESPKLNLAAIRRVRKIGPVRWGHVWLESKRACIFSELTNELVLNGITFFDGRYVVSIDHEFEEKALYTIAVDGVLPVSLIKLRDAFPAESKTGFLKNAHASGVLIALHRERIDNSVCYIGIINHLNSKKVKIRAISPLGDWIDEEMVFNISDITRIDIGGGYLQALTKFSRM